MGRPRPAASRHVTKYLAPGESVVLELKQHWARVLPAILSCLTGLVLVLVAGFTAPASMGALTNVAWWVWLVLLAHLIWRVIEWWDETFVITNRRLVLVRGIFVKKVAMMPLSKVTDMSYNRSLVARALGYGTFVMESAGQEQALSTIEFIRDPDAIYRRLCGLIFGEDDETTEPHNTEESQRRERKHSPHEVYDYVDEEADGSPVDAGGHTGRNANGDRDHFVDAHDTTADHKTVALPVRARTIRTVDDTDPYGMVTERGWQQRREHQSPYATGLEMGYTDLDDESAWSVSREHATQPQPVRRPAPSDAPIGRWNGE